jgi:heat shock protein HslJ
LAARPAWQLSGPHLRISAGQTVIDLTDQRVLAPNQPLAGTRWVATALIGANTTVAPTAAALHRVFLVFSQGWVTGSDGDHALSGPASVSGATINFGPGPAATDNIYADPDASELARRIRTTLQGEVGYQIEADRLTLIGADASGLGVGLQFTATSDHHP